MLIAGMKIKNGRDFKKLEPRDNEHLKGVNNEEAINNRKNKKVYEEDA